MKVVDKDDDFGPSNAEAQIPVEISGENGSFDHGEPLYVDQPKQINISMDINLSMRYAIQKVGEMVTEIGIEKYSIGIGIAPDQKEGTVTFIVNEML